MSPNYLSVQKQRLSFHYNYFAVKWLLHLLDLVKQPFLHTIQLNLFLRFVSTFNSSIKTDRVKTTDTYQRIDNAGKP